jgi:outer membrane protein OmpA-like peptidoglycan-associated protein
VTAGVSNAIGTRGTAKPITRKDALSADALFEFSKDSLSPTGVSNVNTLARELATVNR